MQSQNQPALKAAYRALSEALIVQIKNDLTIIELLLGKNLACLGKKDAWNVFRPYKRHGG